MFHRRFEEMKAAVSFWRMHLRCIEKFYSLVLNNGNELIEINVASSYCCYEDFLYLLHFKEKKLKETDTKFLNKEFADFTNKMTLQLHRCKFHVWSDIISN